jgi:hypothetical protein
MSCTPKTVTITPVNATPTTGPWLFEYPAGHSYNVKASFPVIDLPRDTGCYDITFKIGGSNSLIAFNQTSPILINGSAPPGPGGQIIPQGLPLGPNAKQLVVQDLNSNDAASGPLELNYTLQFTNTDIAHRTLDPVIKNGGKTTRTLVGSHASRLDVANLAIAIAIFITLVFVAYQLVKIRRELARR